jgi:probable HAF family extracellular repeat protein
MKVTAAVAALVALSFGPAKHAAATVPAPIYHVTYLGFAFDNGGGPKLNNKNQVVGHVAPPSNAGIFFDAGNTTTLPSLGGPTSAVLPDAINDTGEVGGHSVTSGMANHAFLYAKGSITDLGTLPGYPSSNVTGLNATGDAVGVSSSADGSSHRAFLYHSGSLTDLGPGTASAINVFGAIVGTSANNRAILFQNGSEIDLGNFGDSSLTSAVDINDSGQIAGTSFVRLANNTFVNHPFLYQSGTWHDLGLPAGLPLGFPTAINNLGQIVGNSGSLGSPSLPPFLYTNGAIYNLDSLLDSSGAGLSLEVAYDINDNGVILAEGVGPLSGGSTGYEAVLLTPVPEPDSGALAGIATGFVVGAWLWRRYSGVRTQECAGGHCAGSSLDATGSSSPFLEQASLRPVGRIRSHPSWPVARREC